VHVLTASADAAVAQGSACTELYPAMVTTVQVLTYLNVALVAAIAVSVCCLFDPLTVPRDVDADDPVAFARWKRGQANRSVCTAHPPARAIQLTHRLRVLMRVCGCACARVGVVGGRAGLVQVQRLVVVPPSISVSQAGGAGGAARDGTAACRLLWRH
jgi:hypothetical protein